MTPTADVTLDVFSALIDSRSGASEVLDRIAAQQHWDMDGEDLYLAWDRAHKALQLACERWESFATLGRRALVHVLQVRKLSGDVDAAMAQLWASLGDWPLWPDVEDGVHELARHHRVGLLSNVDDGLLARTRVASLPLAPGLIITSERARAYKPRPPIYHAAQDIVGASLVHVAASARDVRGALEAGLETVRLARPGHELDADGPRGPLADRASRPTQSRAQACIRKRTVLAVGLSRAFPTGHARVVEVDLGENLRRMFAQQRRPPRRRVGTLREVQG